MPKIPADIRSLCRSYTSETVRIVAAIARCESHPPGTRLQAVQMLWDRGFGKPAQTHTGMDGEGPITVEIVVRSSNEKVIEHQKQLIQRQEHSHKDEPSEP